MCPTNNVGCSLLPNSRVNGKLFVFQSRASPEQGLQKGGSYLEIRKRKTSIYSYQKRAASSPLKDVEHNFGEKHTEEDQWSVLTGE